MQKGGKMRLHQSNEYFIKGIIALSLFLMASTAFVFNAHSELGNNKNYISHYSFGEITIDGKTYNADLVLWPNKAPRDWQTDLHGMMKNDFDTIIQSGIKTLVYGAGDQGGAYMTNKTRKHLISNGIDVKIFTTHEAVKFLNENGKSDLVAILHVTC